MSGNFLLGKVRRTPGLAFVVLWLAALLGAACTESRLGRLVFSAQRQAQSLVPEAGADEGGQGGGKPLRIASGTVASDEILWALLTEAKALDRLIALSLLVDNPAYSHLPFKAAEALGRRGRVGASGEALLALQPELVVLADFNRPALVHQIAQAKVLTYRIHSLTSIREIEQVTEALARAVQEPEAGKRLLKKFRQELDELKAKGQLLPKKRILGWNSDQSVIGSETIFADILALAGAENAAAHLTGWPKLSQEALAQLRPDCLIVGEEEGEEKNLTKTARLQELRALAYTRAWPALENACLIVMPTRYISVASLFLPETVAWLQQRLTELARGSQRQT